MDKGVSSFSDKKTHLEDDTLIFEKVAALLADYKGIDVSTITMDSSFAELELDSLDVADLVMQIEDELGVSIELDQSVTTMKDLIAKIEEAKNA